MISVRPLVLTHSFAGARNQATDKVDLAQLDAAFAQITDKLNEIIGAMDITLRDDNTLKDSSIEPRHLSSDTYSEIVAIVNGTSSEAGQ